MKPRYILLTLGFSGAILFVATTVAMSQQTGKSSAKAEIAACIASTDQRTTVTGESSDPQALRRALDRASSEMRRRLHMPVMLEVSDDPSEEAEIMELYRSGWIVEATVDEVEAAIDAAAATPEIEDDIAARILAHRASCRFFYKG